MKTIEIIGVLGAGQMGGGIAHVAAAAGYRVLLADTDKQRAEAGKGRIDTFMQRSVDKGKMEAADKQAALDRITCVDGIEDLGESDFAIEAATESIELKKRLFRSLDGENFSPVIQPSSGGYFVATDRPDQILVPARTHQIDVIDERGYQQDAFSGINYMKLELDFMVG